MLFFWLLFIGFTYMLFSYSHQLERNNLRLSWAYLDMLKHFHHNSRAWLWACGGGGAGRAVPSCLPSWQVSQTDKKSGTGYSNQLWNSINKPCETNVLFGEVFVKWTHYLEIMNLLNNESIKDQRLWVLNSLSDENSKKEGEKGVILVTSMTCSELLFSSGAIKRI